MEKSGEEFANYWKNAKETLLKTEKENGFGVYADRIIGCDEKDGKLILYAASKFYCAQISKKFLPAITKTVAKISGRNIPVAVEWQADRKPDADFTLQKKSESEKEVEKALALHARCERSHINPDYTFDRFVQGDNSAFAFNAALAVAKDPGRSYNPCLIYGGVGLGKTHLLNAIGNYVLSNHDDMKVLYISAVTFVNDYITAVGNGTGALDDFRSSLRRADVLLMDDVQFIQKKTKSQEELFYIFEELYESKKQMVFTCDRPLAELEGVMDRLTSRFSRGLNADLQPPAYETRVAIIKNKCKLQNKVLGEDIIDYVASNVQSNVRDLEASLTTLISYSNLLGVPITLEKAKELLSGLPFMHRKQETNVTMDAIMKSVAAYYKISVQDLKGKKRNKTINKPRQVAMYLAYTLLSYSYMEIGEEFGGRDHTTVMHAVDRIRSQVSVDKELRSDTEAIRRAVGESGNLVEKQ